MRQVGKLTPKGNNIYEDNYGRTFIGDSRNNRAYLLTKADNKEFSFYQYRQVLPLIILIIIGSMYNWYVAIVISLVLIVVLEILYRVLFLRKLQCYDNIEFEKRGTVIDRLVSNDSRINYLRLVGSAALPVLLIINLKDEVTDFSIITSNTNQLILLVVTIGLILYAIYMFVTTLIAVLKANKN